MKSALFYIVSSNYIAVMQIPLLRGRFFTERDNLSSTPVVVIDYVMARQNFPGLAPIGQQISLTVAGPCRLWEWWGT